MVKVNAPTVCKVVPSASEPPETVNAPTANNASLTPSTSVPARSTVPPPYVFCRLRLTVSEPVFVNTVLLPAKIASIVPLATLKLVAVRIPPLTEEPVISPPERVKAPICCKVVPSASVPSVFTATSPELSKPLLDASCKVPAPTVVPPLYVFAPDKTTNPPPAVIN